MYKGERFNSISHLVAAALVLVGASILITLAALEGGTLKLASVTIYSVTLFILYLSSTLFHSLQGRAKYVFQKIDHLSIYLLIAGTYTPFALLAVKGSEGWWLFGAVWSLAVVGMIVDLVIKDGPRVIPVIIYLAMGWSCVFAWQQIVDGLTPLGFYLLLAGGVTYTVGVIFYVLDERVAWCHEIWHLFVIGGSACHYLAILQF